MRPLLGVSIKSLSIAHIFPVGRYSDSFPFDVAVSDFSCPPRYAGSQWDADNINMSCFTERILQSTFLGDAC